jgi:fermentation-respiration switch protein FrsA (DUF1100 family)
MGTHYCFVRRKAMTILTQWILGAILALVVLKCLVLWLQPRLAFYSVPGPTPAPAPFHSFEVVTVDGVRVAGWQTPLGDDRPVLLYFCGNAGNLADRMDLLMGVARSQCGIVAFNYRGTGESMGSPSEKGIYRDAGAVYDYLTQGQSLDPARLVFWGHSIGGAVATELATRRECAGIILESTFRSAKLMARRMMPLLPIGLFLTYRFDNEGNIPRIQCPLLFIHGTEDHIVPKEDSEYLHRLAQSPKGIWLVDQAGHNDIYMAAGDEFYDRICAFATEAVGPPTSR